jgi:hypothetical protein
MVQVTYLNPAPKVQSYEGISFETGKPISDGDTTDGTGRSKLLNPRTLFFFVSRAKSGLFRIEFTKREQAAMKKAGCDGDPTTYLIQLQRNKIPIAFRELPTEAEAALAEDLIRERERMRAEAKRRAEEQAKAENDSELPPEVANDPGAEFYCGLHKHNHLYHTTAGRNCIRHKTEPPVEATLAARATP